MPNTVKSLPNPFAVLFLSAFLLYCLVGLVWFPEVATTTLQSYGRGWSSVLLGVSAFGSAATLIGVYTAPLRGLFVERAGLWSVSMPCAVYGVAGLVNNGVRSLGFCLLLLALAGAGAWRIWQISRAVEAAKAVTQ